MATTETATAVNRPCNKPAGVPASFHIAAAVWLAGMLVFSHLAPDGYEAAMQEDRFVEWTTVTLFGAAAYLRLRDAFPGRHVFEILVGLFCLFVAGEEFSWGQRLFGFRPPALFLAHNTQQEFTLHNFAAVFGQPKTVLMLALFGYGVVLPLLRRRPCVTVTPWFIAAIVLLIWYPVTLTGEWIELFAGALFLITIATTTRQFWRSTAIAAALGIVLAFVSAWTARTNPLAVACAKKEVGALMEDVAVSLREYDGLLRRDVHKRVQTAIDQAYMAPDLGRYRAVQCEGELDEAAAARRRFAIDAWGLAYWVRAEQKPEATIVTVYSFGPNRRRDSEPGRPTGDDVLFVSALGRNDQDLH